MTQTLKRGLRDYTSARVGLQRTGSSVATQELLDFQLAHAQARDAVHARLDINSLVEGLTARGLGSCVLQSRARDRSVYLRHPELGRELSKESAATIPSVSCDICFVIADGLSALAAERHALPLLDQLLPLLSDDWPVGPVCIVEQGRVAIGDAVGEAMHAKLSVVLIGERPGLSSCDSLGAYITWSPRAGLKDSERNCISNIHPEGLGYGAAAGTLHFYIRESLKLKLSGVGLKLRLALP
jgi:ethanolamine ammonia-lyase small subunit